MLFNKISTALMILASFGFVACSPSKDNVEEDHVIGETLKNMSALAASDNASARSIVVFDETVHRIHQFDLSQMTFVRSFDVQNPDEKHFVLYQNEGNFIVDLTTKSLTIINKYGQKNESPIRLQGQPRSAAFREDLGLLVIYDDLMSVGMLKLDSNGEIANSWIGGPVIFANETISAGDILDNGNLILALSDGSIANVDLVQSMSQKKWVYSRFTTNLSEINWVGPVPGTQQVLLKMPGRLALVDTAAHSILSNYTMNEAVHKTSKRRDPHVLLSWNNDLKLAYVQGSQIQVRSLFRQNYSILTSNLDLGADLWTVADASFTSKVLYNDLNEVKSARQLKRYRFSDMLTVFARKIPDQSQVQVSNNFAFALFPSELGYAVRYDLSSENTRELKLFNVQHIGR